MMSQHTHVPLELSRRGALPRFQEIEEDPALCLPRTSVGDRSRDEESDEVEQAPILVPVLQRLSRS